METDMETEFDTKPTNIPTVPGRTPSEHEPTQATTNTKCDNYKLTYGDETPETLANEDSYVASLYNTWQNWKQ